MWDASAADSLSQALGRLDALDRTAVVLIYGRHYTLKQAAKLLDTTPHRLSASLMGALRTIAQAIEDGPSRPRTPC